MTSHVLLNLHPTLTLVAESDSLKELAGIAHAYLERKFGWCDEIDETWLWSQHKAQFRHPRSPRFDFFQPDMEIVDKPIPPPE